MMLLLLKVEFPLVFVIRIAAVVEVDAMTEIEIFPNVSAGQG